MKKLLAILILLTLTSCFLFKGGVPILKTWTIDGNIELVNDCSGVGADNPASTLIIVKLFYKGDSIADMTKTIDVALVTANVTSTGNWTVSSPPTNQTADYWTVDYTDECQYIICTQGSCENRGTNSRQPYSATNQVITVRYNYGCTCI